MNATSFFSSNYYLFLPTANNPKVALAIDSFSLAKNSFKLYNPFSQKGKLLKKVSQVAFNNFNEASKLLIRGGGKKKGHFVDYLETKLNKLLVSSLYFSTIKDKLVMQLQTPNAEIIGYLKYPLTKIGIQHLNNERKAIQILSKKKIIHNYLLNDTFEGTPYLLLSSLEGEIGIVEHQQVTDLLLKFDREEKYALSQHPRFIELKQSLIDINLLEYIPLVQKISQSTSNEYSLVYEHGDFTPWNIVKVDENYIPFDFEHFVEDGLEYFDLIKYYYQIGKLLKNMKGKELLIYISGKIITEESKQIIQLFVIKEIVRNKQENEDYNFEKELLNLINSYDK